MCHSCRTVERSQNDLPHDGRVGRDDGTNRTRPYTESTLPCSVAARSGGGGVFSRGGRVSRPLVFAPRSGKRYEELYVGNSAFFCNRNAYCRVVYWTTLERGAWVAL